MLAAAANFACLLHRQCPCACLRSCTSSPVPPTPHGRQQNPEDGQRKREPARGRSPYPHQPLRDQHHRTEQQCGCQPESSDRRHTFCYSTSLASQTTGPARTRCVKQAAPVPPRAKTRRLPLPAIAALLFAGNHSTLTCFVDPKRPAMSLFGHPSGFGARPHRPSEPCKPPEFCLLQRSVPLARRGVSVVPHVHFNRRTNTTRSRGRF